MFETPQVVEAQEFRAIDAAGRVRARFGLVGSQGRTPALHLLRADGMLAVEVEVDDDLGFDATASPQVWLFDKQGVLRISLGVAWGDGEEFACISVCGSDGKNRISVVVLPGDYGEMSISDAEGRVKWMKREF